MSSTVIEAKDLERAEPVELSLSETCISPLKISARQYHDDLRSCSLIPSIIHTTDFEFEMCPKMEEYKLLPNQDSRESQEDYLHDEHGGNGPTGNQCDICYHRKARQMTTARKWWSKHYLAVILTTSLMANLLSGILAFITVNNFKPKSCIQNISSDTTNYAGLSRDSSVRFPWSTGYGPEITNHSLADERWEAIDINPGILALPDDWARDHNLPPTQRFPWDVSKGVYTLTAFHTLHCLKNIHRLLYDAHHKRPLSRDIGHAMHCVDHMRKDAICNADDFLLPTPPDHYHLEGPRGQARVCRNWEDLLAFAGEHHACYQHISDDEEDFAKNHEEIERYMNCPEGSPYWEAVQGYRKGAASGVAQSL